MKKIFCGAMIFLCGIANAQSNFYEAYRLGEEAAVEYIESFMLPGVQATAYNLSTGWVNSARALDKWDFDIQVRAQGAFAGEENQTFIFDPEEYQAIAQRAYDSNSVVPADIEVSFADGSRSPRRVATIFGFNDPDQTVVVRAVDPVTGATLEETSIELAQGFGDTDYNLMPTAFLQGSLGLGSGLEFKGRVVPRFQVEEGDAFLWGAGLQYQFSRLFTAEDREPSLVFSIFGGYTHFNAQYNFVDGAVISGDNQRTEVDVNSFTASFIAGTNFEVLNFFGSLGYFSATSEGSLLGTYTITDDSVIFDQSLTTTDPITIREDITDIMATVGGSLKLWVFKVEASYTFSDYDTASAGIGFTF